MLRRLVILSSFFALFLAASQEAWAVFELSVAPRQGGQNIRFEASRPGSLLQNEEVALTVQTDEAVQYRIFMNVYQPLTNELGKVIPQNSFIVYSPSSPLGTLRTQLETPVTMGQVPVYTSNAAGDSDSFVLVFNVRVPEDQPGGVYHTQISFTAEAVTAAGQLTPVTRTLDVRVEIRPTFNIRIQNQKGGRDIDLGRIDKNNTAGTEQLDLVIESNIGSPYRLIQELAEPLLSAEGVPLSDDAFVFQVAGGGHGVISAGGGEQPLDRQNLIYTSDEIGQGDEIQLRYSAKPGPDAKAGFYTGLVRLRFESKSPLVPGEVITLPVRLEIQPILDLQIEVRDGLGIHFGMVKPGETSQQEREVVLTVVSNLSQPYQLSQVVSRKLMTQEGKALPDEAFKFHGSRTATGSVTVAASSAVSEGETVVFISDKKGTPEKIALYYTLSIPRESPAGNYSSDIKYSITTL